MTSRFRLCAALAAVMVAVLSVTAAADVMTLGSNNPPGSPLVVAPGSTTGSLFVNVTNNVGSDPPADFMTAWQFRLVLIPDAGATGTLSFNAPATGTAPNPPSYVFGSSGSGISVTTTASQLDANDIHTGGGVQVPASPGANLLSVGFGASGTANGTWGVYAVRGAATTVWTDNAAVPQTRFFDNVPSGSGNVRIADVQVQAVPEPTSLMVVAVAAAGLVAGGRSCGRRRPRD